MNFELVQPELQHLIEISLNRKLDGPRTARDERRRTTHNEGKMAILFDNLFFLLFCRNRRASHNEGVFCQSSVESLSLLISMCALCVSYCTASV